MLCDHSVYLDHAAATPVRREVLDKMLPVQCHFHGSTAGSHSVARRTTLLIKEAEKAVLSCLGGQSGSVTFTDGQSQAALVALLGLALGRGREGHIITTVDADESVLAACHLLQSLGYRVTRLQPDGSGKITWRTVEEALQSDTTLVSLPLVNRFTGAMHPLEEITQKAVEKGILVHLEAGLGCLVGDLEAEKWGAHALTLSTHLVGGPQGVAAVWTAPGVQLCYPHTPSENLAGIRGFAQALCYLTDERADWVASYGNLRKEFLRLLSLALPQVNPVGGAQSHPGICTLQSPDISSKELVYQLDRLGVCAADTPYGVRLSFGRTTTSDELQQAVLALSRAFRAAVVRSAADADAA